MNNPHANTQKDKAGSAHFTFSVRDLTEELTMKAALEQERRDHMLKSNLMSAGYSSTEDSIIVIDELGKVCISSVCMKYL